MKKWIWKFAVMICLIISVILMICAAWLYPGGSISDPDSEGFDWSKNFICNLFADRAINGEVNPSRLWAIIGMAFHSVGYGIFFFHMAGKMTMRHAAVVLKTVGLTNVLFSFLVVTSLHDIMITISSTLTLLGLFYITVFIFRTRLHFFKFACVLCMLTFYFTLFLYGCGDWGLLAIMQKVSLTGSMLLVLGLEYFTTREDFMNRISATEGAQVKGK